MRRGIGMLGLLHKCVLGQEHMSLTQFFPPVVLQPNSYSTRSAALRHGKQILDHCDAGKPDFFYRSLFGMVYVYNLLPQAVVNTETVSDFQRMLTAMAKQSCRDGGQFDRIFCHIFTRTQNSLHIMKMYRDILDRTAV